MKPTKQNSRPSYHKRKQPQKPGFSPYYLYGIHAVEAALKNPRRKIHRLFLTKESEQSHGEKLSKALGNRYKSIEIMGVSRRDIEQTLTGQINEGSTSGRSAPKPAPSNMVHQGILLECEPLSVFSLEDFIESHEEERLLIVALDQVTDPHNVGAIMRSACAFGASALLVPQRNRSPETAVLAKSASGALDHLPIIEVTNLSRSLDTLKKESFMQVLGLAGEAKEELGEITLSERLVVVMGAEGTGLRRLTRETCSDLAHLPTSGPLRDLNVSNASAITLYEVARQWKKS